ncbi:hypothetical protein MA16_Dca027576 [Dendrobium catenatum]|uniref:Uncharacterized protein n=1 Tax=Dendrobium catenatum TaxID=906689 RepID=A0A2I0W383_9ASPA|nr:hypothetical protein MA16_Dca027576 [Dendrobium catenatum]
MLQEPLHWLKGSNVVIVDPPRKGVEQSLLDALRAISKFKDSKVPKSSIINEKEEKRPWILRAREATVHVESKAGINWAKDQTWPEFIIYVSCGWESFKENCQYLLFNNAWQTSAIRLRIQKFSNNSSSNGFEFGNLESSDVWNLG